MVRYWLTPVVEKQPLRLGSARLYCEPVQELESLRAKLATVHPRLLPMFKANLLLSDDEDACGSEIGRIDLLEACELVFDGSPLRLSHCGEAFLDRILPVPEAESYVRAWLEREGIQSLLSRNEENASASGLSELQGYWIKRLLEFLESGWEVILLREDGS